MLEKQNTNKILMVKPPKLLRYFYSSCRLQLLSCIVAIATLGIESIVPGSPVRAYGADLLQCEGFSTTTFSPGLTNTPKPTTFSSEAQLGPCVSLSDPKLKSGGFKFTGQSPSLSCIKSGVTSITEKYTWNTGETSTIRYVSTVVNQAAATVTTTATGRVESGKFQGYTAVRQVVILTTNLAGCVTPSGVTTLTGPATLTLTSPL